MVEMKINIKETLNNYKRVLQIARKPTMDEFVESTRICLIGMGVVGIIGFTIYLLTLLLENKLVVV